MSTHHKIKGIYLIERIRKEGDNSEPFLYVGQAKNIFERMAQHFTEHGQFIDASIQKAGCEHFQFRIREVVKDQTNRDVREKYWIDFYTKQYGESALYNNESGGKQGKTRINLERNKIVAETEKEIRLLFEQETGRSIYAIAEKYDLLWNEVTELRKPLLKKKGLKWKKEVGIVNSDGNTPDGWNGGRLTEKQYHGILYLKNTGEDNDTICEELNISISDLTAFDIELQTTGTYKTAKSF
jgi:hypothetical protein